MWSQTLGHNKQIDQLSKALREGKVAHAYLLVGPEGIGKKGVAIGLAQGLNCLQTEAVPCENCLACQKIVKNTHPDCLLIEPVGKTIRIEVLRELKQKAYLHPLEGRAKIFIIDGAEKMTDAGANALLKVLEEPPPVTYLILISAKPFLLLPTIRSRCQRLEFSPLPDTLITTLLEKTGMGTDAAKQRTLLSQGSLAQAIRLEPSLITEAARYLEQISQDRRPQTIFQLSETLVDEEEKLPLLLQAFSFLTHQKIVKTPNQERIKDLSKHWQAIQQALDGLETYANKRLLVENLLFNLASTP